MIAGSIADLYEERLNNWSDIQLHLPYMRELVIETNAQTVIELGVRSGNSTTAFLSGLLETGGHLWSVDIGEPPFIVVGDLGDVQWTYVRGDDISHAVVSRLPQQADIVFIDTSHWFWHTRMELLIYGSTGKIILLHDTELERPHAQPPGEPPFPVRTAIEGYVTQTGRSYEERPGSYGLGIIR